MFNASAVLLQKQTLSFLLRPFHLIIKMDPSFYNVFQCALYWNWTLSLKSTNLLHLLMK